MIDTVFIQAHWDSRDASSPKSYTLGWRILPVANWVFKQPNVIGSAMDTEADQNLKPPILFSEAICSSYYWATRPHQRSRSWLTYFNFGVRQVHCSRLSASVSKTWRKRVVLYHGFILTEENSFIKPPIYLLISHGLQSHKNNPPKRQTNNFWTAWASGAEVFSLPLSTSSKGLPRSFSLLRLGTMKVFNTRRFITHSNDYTWGASLKARFLILLGTLSKKLFLVQDWP